MSAMRVEALTSDDAFKKIVRILNAGDQSVWNIRKKLEAAGYSAEQIDASVARALQYGLLDDARYAQLFIRSKLRAGKGTIGIARDLKNMCISLEDIPDWPSEYPAFIDEEIELQRAFDLLSRKPPRGKHPQANAYRKLVSYGYSPSVASAATSRWLEQ